MKKHDPVPTKNRFGIMQVLFISIILLSLSTHLLAQVYPPTATTEAASGVGLNEATINGTVNANGYETIVYFEYGYSTAYGVTVTADQSPVTGSTDTPVSTTLLELDGGTTYHYRVVAINSYGTTYGADMTFTTSGLPPLTVTVDASDLTASSATLNGTVFGRGLTTVVTFEYGTDTAYGTTVTAVESPIGTPLFNYNIPVTAPITGLTNNTTYHFRVVATNANGTSYGEDLTFTMGTVGTAPEATILAASAITSESATLNGTVNPNDSETTVTFEYGVDTTFGYSFVADQSPVSGTEETAVSYDAYELLPNTTYYYRIIAENANDADTSTTITFITIPLPPTAETTEATSLSGSSATLNGMVNANNASSIVTFEYGTDTAYGTTVTADQNPVTGDTDTPVSTSISGLSEGVTYHFRVVAVNAGGTTYGEDMSFITGVTAPTVITEAATDISISGATLNGTVNANNFSTSVTFELGADTNYGRTIAASPGTVTGSSDTDVSAIVSSLVENTTYHYRLMGTNISGTVYGEDMTFTTGSGPMATTLPATEVGLNSAVLNGLVNANDSITAITFEYGLTAEYGTIVTADQSPVTGDSDTPVSTSIASLTHSTTYHFRVIAENINGITHGIDQTFTTQAANPDAPEAVTNYPSAISSTDATLSGTINPKNRSTVVIFHYGLSTEYTDTVTAQQSPVNGEYPITVSAPITDLISDTTYHCRVVAENEIGTVYGNDISFITIPSLPPTYATDPATNITQNSAVLNGTVNANNTGILGIYFQFGTSIAYNQLFEAVPFTVGGMEDTPVSYTVTGLEGGHTYYYRIMVQSTTGILYGNHTSFYTEYPPYIYCSNDSVSDIKATTGVLHGSVFPDNTQLTVTFEYGLDYNFDNAITADQSPVSGDGYVPVSETLTRLQPHTEYYWRVVAQNDDATVYSYETSFTTADTLPVAITGPSTAITDSSATLNGKVKASNLPTTVSFEYGLTTEYSDTAYFEIPVEGDSLTSVYVNIDELSGNSTYHYRVVAENSQGMVYGDDKTFYTGAAAPEAVTLEATDITANTATLNGTVIANNASTTITFEYGPTEEYGRTINAAPNMVDSSQVTEVSAAINGLMGTTTYHYRVVAQNNMGTSYGEGHIFITTEPVSIEDDEYAIPTTFSLSQNYPNPFNPVTVIEYRLPTESHVLLEIYNLEGQKVNTLVNRERAPGVYHITFNPSHLPSGIYLYRLKAGQFEQVKKMVFLK